MKGFTHICDTHISAHVPPEAFRPSQPEALRRPRVAEALADSRRSEPLASDEAQAIQYRSLDRDGWFG